MGQSIMFFVILSWSSKQKYELLATVYDLVIKQWDVLYG